MKKDNEKCPKKEKKRKHPCLPRVQTLATVARHSSGSSAQVDNARKLFNSLNTEAKLCTRILLTRGLKMHSQIRVWSKSRTRKKYIFMIKIYKSGKTKQEKRERWDMWTWQEQGGAWQYACGKRIYAYFGFFFSFWYYRNTFLFSTGLFILHSIIINFVCIWICR